MRNVLVRQTMDKPCIKHTCAHVACVPTARVMLCNQSQGAEPNSSPVPASLPRSVAWGGGSFIAGHSAFARSSSIARSPASSRMSLDNTAYPPGTVMIRTDCSVVMKSSLLHSIGGLCSQ